jgi:hypothetical protein
MRNTPPSVKGVELCPATGSGTCACLGGTRRFLLVAGAFLLWRAEGPKGFSAAAQMRAGPIDKTTLSVKATMELVFFIVSLPVLYGLVTLKLRLPVFVLFGSTLIVYVPVVGRVCCDKLKLPPQEKVEVRVEPSGFFKVTVTQLVVLLATETVTCWLAVPLNV